MTPARALSPVQPTDANPDPREAVREVRTCYRFTTLFYCPGANEFLLIRRDLPPEGSQRSRWRTTDGAASVSSIGPAAARPWWRPLLVLPVFLMLVLGVIVLGIGLFYQQQITNAAREAARYAAIHSATAELPHQILARSWWLTAQFRMAFSAPTWTVTRHANSVAKDASIWSRKGWLRVRGVRSALRRVLERATPTP